MEIYIHGYIQIGYTHRVDCHYLWELIISHDVIMNMELANTTAPKGSLQASQPHLHLPVLT